MSVTNYDIDVTNSNEPSLAEMQLIDHIQFVIDGIYFVEVNKEILNTIGVESVGELVVWSMDEGITYMAVLSASEAVNHAKSHGNRFVLYGLHNFEK